MSRYDLPHPHPKAMTVYIHPSRITLMPLCNVESIQSDGTILIVTYMEGDKRCAYVRPARGCYIEMWEES